MKRRFLKNQEQLGALAGRKVVSREERRVFKKKKIVIAFLLSGLLFGVVYFFIYSSVFKIGQVVVSGINEAENVNAVQIETKEYIRGYKFFIWPKDNILFLSEQRLADFLSQRVRADDLRIKKKLLKTVEVEGKDRLPVFLWREGEQGYYIEKTGQVAAAVPEDKIKYNLPTISRSTTTVVAVGQMIIAESDVSFLLTVWDKIKNNFRDWKMTKIEVTDYKSREASFYTNEGWHLIVAMDGEIDKALAKLAVFLQSDKIDRKRLQYIDLRIPDKIFYK